ncbi:PfkB family carbohydrate kinase [Clostridium beijerinckii]|uniref:PfkB family carbohydrate kinase n=1 Tax=Clostridium beijerinckii TaxID=1520 RepID=UPI00098C4C96|nr:PfkB family carbohydrate kinase [Clostridium beijerinckii]MBA8936539.1 sugar/nucleoside kinase (ribokinase family) [Clostridium beijerinckii]NRU40993.1 sugar/nucleoside kinase (ribokinase family) [Clostridium beijerinckii]NSA95732.1 sugar/nucleoside kinase (ribokinase family) [Clostridium beijerinckii]OOM59437.1 fructosamine kinase FrlD [Clostridium beijerinckii]OOM68348.1 fructosamine kinase FrlD [Clostridium beijerinckii]
MKVIGLGDNVIDRYMNKNMMYPGGNAINFAVNAKKCEVDSAYLGVFGDDEEAELIKHSLEDLGVDISKCRKLENGTTKRCDINIIDGERELLNVDIGANWPKPIRIEKDELEYLAEFDLIHSSCNAKLEDQIYKLKEIDSIITFDFSTKDKYRTDEYLQKLCPYIDLALFSCENMNINEIKIFQKKIHDFGCKYVLVTMGKNGQVFFDGNKYYNGKVKLVNPVDTMGAGDSFIAAFIVTLLRFGWKDNNKLTENEILSAFEKASNYSADICMIEGAYGYGKPIKEKR